MKELKFWLCTLMLKVQPMFKWLDNNKKNVLVQLKEYF